MILFSIVHIYINNNLRISLYLCQRMQKTKISWKIHMYVNNVHIIHDGLPSVFSHQEFLCKLREAKGFLHPKQILLHQYIKCWFMKNTQENVLSFVVRYINLFYLSERHPSFIWAVTMSCLTISSKLPSGLHFVLSASQLRSYSHPYRFTQWKPLYKSKTI